MPEAPRVLFLGDSITAGFGLLQSQAFPALLEEELTKRGRPMKAVNAGFSGDTTAGGLRRLPPLIDRKPKPAAAVVALGLNDIMRGVDPGTIEANLREILGILQRAGIRPLLCGMRVPPLLGPAHAERFSNLYSRFALELRIASIPFLLEGVMGRPELNLPDRLHPNAEGQLVIARLLLAPVARLLTGLAPGATPHR